MNSFTLIIKIALLLLVIASPEIAMAKIDASAQTSDNVIATIIMLAKYILLIIGMALILRMTVKSSNGEKISGDFYAALAITILPAITISFYEAIEINGKDSPLGTTSGALINGKHIIEYMMAETGLISAGLIAQWAAGKLVYIAVLYIAGALAVYQSYTTDDWSHLKRWAGFALVMGVIFNPMALTASSPGMTSLRAKVIANTETFNMDGFSQGDVSLNKAILLITSNNPDTADLDFRKDNNLPNNGALLTSKATTNGMGYSPNPPLVLSYINYGLDSLIGSITGLIGDSKFGAFGISFTKLVAERAAASITKAEVKKRVIFFINNCHIRALNILGQRKDGIAGAAHARGPGNYSNDLREIGNPFSDQMMALYKASSASADPTASGPLTNCAYMVKNKFVLYGKESDAGIATEILADHYMQTLKLEWPDAIKKAQAVDITTTTNDVKDIINSAFQKLTGEASTSKLADSIQGDKQSSWLNMSNTILAPVISFVKDIPAFVGTGLSAVGGVYQATVVNKQMPMYMGFAQMVFLALFPIIWMFALLPGASGILLHFFMLLFWAKSYIISWALISNFDNWLNNAYFLDDSMDYTDQFAMSEVISDLQVASPMIMFMILFGAMGAAQGIGNQSGAAAKAGASDAAGAGTAAARAV